jgi:hypothetical protein
MALVLLVSKLLLKIGCNYGIVPVQFAQSEQAALLPILPALPAFRAFRKERCDVEATVEVSPQELRPNCSATAVQVPAKTIQSY